MLLSDDTGRSVGGAMGRPLYFWLSGKAVRAANRRRRITRFISPPTMFALRGRWHR